MQRLEDETNKHFAVPGEGPVVKIVVEEWAVPSGDVKCKKWGIGTKNFRCWNDKRSGNCWVKFKSWIPSGKRLHNYGKSLFLMGISTISMAIFHSYVTSPEGTIYIGLFKSWFCWVHSECNCYCPNPWVSDPLLFATRKIRDGRPRFLHGIMRSLYLWQDEQGSIHQSQYVSTDCKLVWLQKILYPPKCSHPKTILAILAIESYVPWSKHCLSLVTFPEKWIVIPPFQGALIMAKIPCSDHGTYADIECFFI